eukprot:366436-Chlamydomonas_euryale.AAC.18
MAPFPVWKMALKSQITCSAHERSHNMLDMKPTFVALPNWRPSARRWIGALPGVSWFEAAVGAGDGCLEGGSAPDCGACTAWTEIYTVANAVARKDQAEKEGEEKTRRKKMKLGEAYVYGCMLACSCLIQSNSDA